MTSLSIRSLSVHLDGRSILHDVDLQVDSGSSLAVLGPSGVGKTTLLRAVAGLATVAAGQVVLGWDDVTETPTRERGIALVAQQPSLEPQATLAANVERPLRFQDDGPVQQRRPRALRELFRFGVGARAESKASETSRGEQQMAATARGTVRKPKLLLLDEPVIALDPRSRRQMIRQLRLRHRAEGTTMLVVTNDWEVAAGLGDAVSVLLDGSIVQTGTPTELYDEPASTEVAELTGRWQLNRLAGTIRQLGGNPSEVVTAAGAIRTWRDVGTGQVLVGVRPSDLVIADDGDLRGAAVSAVVLGRQSLVDIDADGLRIQAMGPVPTPVVGSEVKLSWRRVHVFRLDGEAVAHWDSA